MEDLRRLLLLRLLVVLGPCVMLFWLRFGLTPPNRCRRGLSGCSWG
ncbi:MAG: hypothetical protein U1F59_05185 [Candidatus Competibacteraceae bacterium]